MCLDVWRVVPNGCHGRGMACHRCVVARECRTSVSWRMRGLSAFMVGGVGKFTMEDADLFFKMLSPAPSTWSRL